MPMSKQSVSISSRLKTWFMLYRTLWSADHARDILQKYIVEVFADEDRIGVVDETGFIKKGTRSVGVKRQYSGTAGKIENSQIGTFLSYATGTGHVFLDRRLYLPEEWANDAERRTQAKVPADVSFQTEPEQAMAMLEQAWQAGVPMRWVAGDEVYGDATELRDSVARHGRWYVLAVRRRPRCGPNAPQWSSPNRRRGVARGQGAPGGWRGTGGDG